MGTGADDLLALIEFTPLCKTKVHVKLPFATKKKKIYIYCYICMQQEQNNRYLPTLTIVKVYAYKLK